MVYDWFYYSKNFEFSNCFSQCPRFQCLLYLLSNFEFFRCRCIFRNLFPANRIANNAQIKMKKVKRIIFICSIYKYFFSFKSLKIFVPTNTPNDNNTIAKIKVSCSNGINRDEPTETIPPR